MLWENVQEKVLAGSIISDGAGKASAIIDSFANWLFAGFGAAIALLLSNHDVQTLVPRATIGWCVKLFAWSTGLVVLAKVLSIFVVASAEGGKVGREGAEKMMKDMKERGDDRALDPNVIFSEAMRAAVWPGRFLMARAFAKVQMGDLASFSRMLLKIVQAQGALTLIQVALFLTVLIRVVRALT